MSSKPAGRSRRSRANWRRLVIPALLVALLWSAAAARAEGYPWLQRVDPAQSVLQRLPPPAGFTRETAAAGSFAEWLRGLPLKAGSPPVLLFNGRRKANQRAHCAVVDIDVGTQDLQQCADAVLRLRAEYLFSAGRADDIAFRFTSGDLFEFRRWSAGVRPSVRGSSVEWRQGAERSGSHKSLRSYLDVLFTYAGSWSLSRELAPIADVHSLRAGDVFIQGGFPGHAVLVIDTAAAADGARSFLLLQSYMPAQDMQILCNPADPDGGPWFSLDFGAELRTPEWVFSREDLKRFR